MKKEKKVWGGELLSGRLSEAFVFCLSVDLDQSEAGKYLQNRPFVSGQREAPLFFFSGQQDKKQTNSASHAPPSIRRFAANVPRSFDRF
jgi:hypothetical protein